MQSKNSGSILGRKLIALICWCCLATPYLFAGSTLEATPGHGDDGGPRWWSFQPPQHVLPPKVRDNRWIKSPIDNFILAKLEEKNLTPAPPADKSTLIRRATFDLVGLPPTPEEIDAFLSDPSSNAFAKVINRLLASPAYGERWGRHWLDVVRYADARDLIQLPVESDFREAWRYRDWVVDAFNRDMPYDEFIMRQLAGDLMQPPNPAEIDKEALIATGLLAIADFVPGDVDKEQMIADYVNDQIDVVGRAFLGLTLACARCHDHKFDPISTEDYYALAGIFFSTRLIPSPVPGNTPLVRVPLLPKTEVERIEADKKRQLELETQIKTSTDLAYLASLEHRVIEQTARYLVATWDYKNRSPNEPEISLAEFAKKNNLYAQFLAQWLDYLGLRDYQLFDSFRRDVQGISGLRLWSHSETLPGISLNGSDAPAQLKTATLPPRSLGLSPSKTNGVAIGWKSPFTGTVRLAGNIAAADPTTEKGVQVSLDVKTPAGWRELTSGSITKSGSHELEALPNADRLKRIEVRAGDMIELGILPQNSSNQTVIVAWTISENDGDRVWNAVRDIMRGPEQDGISNPLPDAYGNPRIWHLFGMADVKRLRGEPSKSNAALAHWGQTVRDATAGKVDRAATGESARQLVNALQAAHEQKELDAAKKSPAEQALARLEVFKFQANDPQLMTTSDGRVTFWPNRAGTAEESATVVPDTAGPLKTTTVVGGTDKPVLRFSGNELLQAFGAAPTVGSLFLVFKMAESAKPGQRLIGWEDSSAGKHGLGIMLEPSGELRAILRKNSAAGDIADARKSAPDFEIVSVTWGPSGTTLRRNRTGAGANKQIDALSPDPEIKALRIGGPGSGSSARFRGDLAELRVYGQQLDGAALELVENELYETWMSPVPREVVRLSPARLLYDELISPRGPFWLKEGDKTQWLPAEATARLAKLKEEMQMLKKRAPTEIPRAVVVQDGGPKETKHEGFKDAQVYLRGNPKNLGKTVPRGFPRVLAGNKPERITQGSGRLQLARWIANPSNPLTARVLVNRIWQHHFGEGIVRSSNNFGKSGQPPTHPELLDYLAGRFVESGWSMKAMHRLLMLSSTYQQSSEASSGAIAGDPENYLLGRMNRRRLDAEVIRDSLLATTGRLDMRKGGPGTQVLAAPRRTLYLMSVRTGGTNVFGSLFDRPDGSTIIEKRTVSTVAPQALFWMNDQFVADHASALADHVFRDTSLEQNEERIRRIYKTVFGRNPKAAELEIGLKFLTQTHSANPWARYCQILLCANEFVMVD